MVVETSFPKAGEHSVGAARQYCGTLGTIANCQVAVSLHWRKDQLNYPKSWRLYLPKAWCEDSARRAEAHIPKDVVYPTKTDLALELINQAIAWDVPREPCSQICFTATISPFALRCAANVSIMPSRWNRQR
jgi:SRSO17 transposase